VDFVCPVQWTKGHYWREARRREALEIAHASSIKKCTDKLLAVYERVLGAQAALLAWGRDSALHDRTDGRVWLPRGIFARKIRSPRPRPRSARQT
jgi:hypothetical protein